jgi:hypothetical protein
MPGEEHRRQRLRLHDDDPAAGSHHARELLERGLGVGDVVEHVAAPEPVEGAGRGIERGAVALAELESRRAQARPRERPRRLDALALRLDPEHASVGAHRLGQPERVESHAAAHVEAARARRKTEARDDGARRRLVEAVHPLQRDGEGNRLGRAAHAGLARTLTMTLVATATVR